MAFLRAVARQCSVALNTSHNIAGSLFPTHSPFLIFGSATFMRVECQAINHQVISYASITQDAHHAPWLEAGQTLEDWFGECLTIIFLNGCQSCSDTPSPHQETSNASGLITNSKRKKKMQINLNCSMIDSQCETSQLCHKFKNRFPLLGLAQYFSML